LKLEFVMDQEEAEMLFDILDEAEQTANAVLEHHIDVDQMPETVEEFADLTQTQQSRIALIQRLKGQVKYIGD